MIDLQGVLLQKKINVSVPCRVDCGNTLDVRDLSILLHSFNPTTVNIAIDLRTNIELRPYGKGQVRITSHNLFDDEFQLSSISLNSTSGLIAAIVYHFQVSGLHIIIKSESPPKVGWVDQGSLQLV